MASEFEILQSLAGPFIAKAASAAQSSAQPLARMSMMGIHPETGEMVLPEHAFQWMPDSFTDNIAVGWEEKTLPGMSTAIMQWSSNGGRSFSFEAVFYRQMLPEEQQRNLLGATALGAVIGAVGGAAATAGQTVNPNSTDNEPFNVNIEYMVSWLRAFCYPSYTLTANGTAMRPIAPPIALLNIPNMALNEDGSDVVFCVMTECGVTYEKLFPNGQPRSVKVSIGLKQVVQDPKQGGGRRAIKMHSRDEMKAAQIRFADAPAKYGVAPVQRPQQALAGRILKP
jgi:hypothetical protein